MLLPGSNSLPQPAAVDGGIQTKHVLALPALFAPDPATARCVLGFFTVNIRNPHTRKAYGKAAGGFASWCESRDRVVANK
jgi:hypothetical protein